MDAETTLKEQMAAQHAKASMEPRPYGRGDQGGNGRTQEALLASMEPRPYGRGDSQADRDHDVAMALQWGRARVDAETSNPGEWRVHVIPASMGPRPCGRGDEMHQRFCAFAEAMLQWGRARVDAETRHTTWLLRVEPMMLQWGRARVDAETGRGLGRAGGAGRASMGPRPCGRGDQHRLAGPVHRLASFNGAAPVWTRRPCLAAFLNTRPTRFNGAAPVWTRRPARTTSLPSWPGCFNGAAPVWTRRQHGRVVLDLQVLCASMGPRPCGRGDSLGRCARP